MAHLDCPVLHHNVGSGKGASTAEFSIPYMEMPKDLQRLFRKIPSELDPHLPEIILLKPDDGRLYSFSTQEAAFTLWIKHIVPDNELSEIWKHSEFPVQNQGSHNTCWSTMDSEHISEARRIHRLDENITRYSGQFLQDCADRKLAIKRYCKTLRKHYCYGYSSMKGLEYAMMHGLPTESDWGHTGCEAGLPQRRDDVKLHHLLNDARYSKDVKTALRWLKTQPILGSIPIFHPEFTEIGYKTYRGPTSPKSKFGGWHTGSIRAVMVVNGETIALVKNCHGEEKGMDGYLFVSLDVMLVELKTTGKQSFPSPSRLFRSFCYGEVRKEFEREVVNHYIDGLNMDDQVTSSKLMGYLILEGICHNTLANVYQNEDGSNEFIGSPINRALLKWAIKCDMNYNSIKGDSKVIRRSLMHRTPECLGTVVKCQNTKRDGIRVHWKGNGEFILGKCSQYYSKEGLQRISEEKKIMFKGVIDDIVSRELKCIAIAYKQGNEETKEQKKLPSNNLVLLAIFGIKDPCLPVVGDETRALATFEEEIKAEACFVESEEEDLLKGLGAKDFGELEAALTARTTLASKGIRKIEEIEESEDDGIGDDGRNEEEAE